MPSTQSTLKDTVVPKMDMSSAKGAKILREWRKTKKPSQPANTLRPGNIVYVKHYNALTVHKWDKNPIILILNTSNTHVLGFNINWMNKFERKRLIDRLIKEHKINKGKSLNRLQRLRFFKKIHKANKHRNSIRLYHRKEIAKSQIYNLKMGDFFEAVTHNLINT